MTESEFIKGRDLLKIIDPENAWLVDLQGGYSLAKVIYLKSALTEIGVDPGDPQPPKVQKSTSEPAHGMSADRSSGENEGKKIFRSINKLIADRAILSNRFHICTTDQTRSELSRQIAEIQDKIKQGFRRIDYFKATGENLGQVSFSGKDTQLDRLDIYLRIRSLTASISRNKNILKKTKDPNKKKELKEKIKKQMIEKVNHEQTLKNLH